MKNGLLLLIIIVIGAGGYFTRPDEARMRAAANVVLNNPSTVSQGVQGVGATIAGDRAYDNYFVASHYAIKLDNKVLVGCWGAFTLTKCERRAEHTAS